MRWRCILVGRRAILFVVRGRQDLAASPNSLGNALRGILNNLNFVTGLGGSGRRGGSFVGV